MIGADDRAHRFVVHDRDSTYSDGVDRSLAAMGLTVLKTPVRAPTANAFCRRLIGTMRRECLDFMIPLNERHLRAVLHEWVGDCNRGRPHASLHLTPHCFCGLQEISGGLEEASSRPEQQRRD
jgi:transposase InsO family protein